VFFITAATFGATSLIGYTTKRDLTGMGSFLLMGLIGIVIASLVNMFMHSTGLAFMVSILGVLIFTGLIAFQTQQAKRLYNPANGDDANNKLAIFNALGLYINFINLFQTLLSLMGNRN
jgi:FtsH-binding integral membrane protein